MIRLRTDLSGTLSSVTGGCREDCPNYRYFKNQNLQQIKRGDAFDKSPFGN